MKNLFINVATNEKNPNWEKAIARQEEMKKRENDVRSEFDRDYTRIIHSNAYKRLKHKTQVLVGGKLCCVLFCPYRLETQFVNYTAHLAFLFLCCFWLKSQKVIRIFLQDFQFFLLCSKNYHLPKFNTKIFLL